MTENREPDDRQQALAPYTKWVLYVLASVAGIAALAVCVMLLAFAFQRDAAQMAADEVKAERMEAKRIEESGIVCNSEGGNNTSGNICRVTIGNRQCVAILPDDESGNRIEGVRQLVQCERST